jgi:hypothetical protein
LPKVTIRESGHVENWKLILAAAQALTAAGQAPFTRQSVYEWIWRRHPRAAFSAAVSTQLPPVPLL